MSKRIRHASRIVIRAMWSSVLWLLATKRPLRKQPRSAFTRISLTAIGIVAGCYYGNPLVQTWQLAAAFAFIFLALVCMPVGDEEDPEEVEVYTVRPDEDLDLILTVQYTEHGPKGYFADPFNPAYTHIVPLDKHIPDGEEFAA